MPKYQPVPIIDAMGRCQRALDKLADRRRRRCEAWLYEWVEATNIKWWRRLLRLKPVGIIDAERRFATAADVPRVGDHEAWGIYAVRHLGSDVLEAVRRIRDTVDFHRLLDIDDFIYVRSEDLEVLR